MIAWFFNRLIMYPLETMSISERFRMVILSAIFISRTHYQYIEKTASEMPGRPFRRSLKWEGKLNEARNLTTKKFGRSTTS
jgi:hypothetical protein